MPRRVFQQPQSLRESSLQNIACHFECYWCAGRTTTLDYRSLSQCLEPFEYIGDDMVQKLFEILAHKKLLQRHHFQFFLNSNIRHLRIWGKVADHFTVIQAVGVRCQKLTHLNTSGLSTVKDYVLRKLVANLPQLVSLNLNYTRTNLKVLKAVAENCSNLVELYIDRCMSKRGPDYDIQQFANISKQLGVPKLTKMYFCSTRFTVETMVALLTSQRSLQTLGPYININDAFDHMYGKEYQQTKAVPREWVCHLMNLEINRLFRPEHILNENLHLELTFRCCPFVTDLRLSYLTDPTSLQHVSKLRRLKIFHVTGITNIPINFGEHLLPVLRELGKNLISINFSDVSEVSFMLIGRLCPQLESLRLCRIEGNVLQYPAVSDKAVTCFKNLSTLEIRCFRNLDQTFSEELLTTLVCASNLSDMVIVSYNLTDDSISKANVIHGFRHLKRACFRYCDSISVKTGIIFLNPYYPLERLEFYNCKNVTHHDKDWLTEEAERMDFNVKISWFSDS